MLCYNAKIFIFDEPTKGIDVGAKVEVQYYERISIKWGLCYYGIIRAPKY